MTIRVAPVSMRAARYACEQWHYSGSLPGSPGQAVGVWEDGRYIGAVVVARGANRHLGHIFGVSSMEAAELVRVALDQHQAPVSQIVPPALKLITGRSPGLRALVSYADQTQGHHGGIYQAMNWIYLGVTDKGQAWRQRSTGKLLHNRSVAASGVVRVFDRYVPVPRHDECDRVELPGKHRYAWPLDRAMRRQLQALAQPYPSRGRGLSGEPSASPAEGAGSIPADRSTAPS